VIGFRPQSALQALAALDIPVRPFGPKCHLTEGYLGMPSCARPIEVPLPVVQLLGPSAAAARAEITSAFADVLAPSGSRTIEAPGVRPDEIKDLQRCYPRIESAGVAVTKIRFLSDRLAVVDFTVNPGAVQASFPLPLRFSGRAALEDGRWLVRAGTADNLLTGLAFVCLRRS
jgi:hypothetical protein